MNRGGDAQRKVNIPQGLSSHFPECKIDTKKMRLPAKHMRRSFRLYECNRYSGCSGMDRDFERKNPAAAAAGPMTRSYSGS